ncbi:MAG: methyltransferase domain-containing protein [Burkholderiales bacterium]|nr:methyltransferase domain-containing protein [Phycisphaerae bacterium]
MPNQLKFILPDRAVIEQAAQGEKSYAIFNYYGRGPITKAKLHRFHRALKLGATVQTRRVIDMGVADGVLLPTLAHHYDHVAAIDIHEEILQRSRRLVDSLGLKNIDVVNSSDISTDQLRQRLGGGYGLMYLLETLEHVGSQPDIWGSKIAFLKDCFALLEPDGRIIISVPKMVGFPLLIKNVLQRGLGVGYDSLTWGQVLKSTFLKNTDDLEPHWNGGHKGFNHIKLERHLHQHFTVHHQSSSSITVFYVIGRK